MKLKNSITDIPGIEVGQAQDDEALTGCTVILCRKGAVGGVDVRGSAPGTRETDLLNPINLVEKVHAVVLAGGSAFGLAPQCQHCLSPSSSFVPHVRHWSELTVDSPSSQTAPIASCTRPSSRRRPARSCRRAPRA